MIVITLFIVLGIPAFFTARCARTSEVKPLIALGTLLQSPLLLGFLIQLMISLTLPDGGLLGLAALGTLLTGLLAISSGATLGTITNGLLHHLKTNP